MIKIITFLFLLVGSCLQLQAQTVTTNSVGNINISLSADFLDAYINYNQSITISSTQDVNLSGNILSNTIALLPNATYSITLKPSGTGANRNILGDGTTVIKPKNVGTGSPSPFAVSAYPVPVQTSLNIDSTETILGYSVYDLMGILKLTQTINSASSFAIDVSTLPATTYLLRLNLSNGLNYKLQFIKN